MKDRIVSIILFLVGVLNLAPVIVFFSPSRSVDLYGVELATEALLIIVRHRGVLLGLLGMALIYAAFRREAVIPVIVAALIGKLTFLFLVYTSGGHSPEIGRVAMFDIAAIVSLVIAGFLHLYSKRDVPDR